MLQEGTSKRTGMSGGQPAAVVIRDSSVAVTRGTHVQDTRGATALGSRNAARTREEPKFEKTSTPSASQNSLRSVSSGGSAAAAPVPAIQYETQRDVEGEFAKIGTAFRDKETEFNWDLRDKSLHRIRGMLIGGMHQRFPEVFSTGLKSVMDGIMACFKSLRTTLALSASATITDLCDQLREGMDPYLELILATGMKAVQNTKKLVSSASQQAVQALVRGTTYQVRTLHTLYSALQDKSIQLRAAVIVFAKDIVEAAAQNGKVDIVERTGGTDLIEKIVRKTLGDASPCVRETSRSVFAAYQEIWPLKVDSFLNTVEPSVRKQLVKLPRRASELSVSGKAATRFPPNSSRPSSPTLVRSASMMSKPQRVWSAPNSRSISRSATEESLNNKNDDRSDKENRVSSAAISHNKTPPSQQPSPTPSNATPSITSTELQPMIPAEESLSLKPRRTSSDAGEMTDAVDASQQCFAASSAIPSRVGEKKNLLAGYVRQVQDGEADQNVFRKMIRLSRKTAVSEMDGSSFSSSIGAGGSNTKQNGSFSSSTGNPAIADGDIWEAGEKFAECIEAVITFLTRKMSDDDSENCLYLLRTLLQNQAPYFSGYERAILSLLLECRADENLRVCSAAEATLDSYAECMDKRASMGAFREITYTNLDGSWWHMSFDAEILETTNMLREPPPAVAFLFLEKLLRRYDALELEEDIPKLAPLIMKGISHQSMHVRKRSVEAFVTMHEIVGTRLLEHFPNLDDPLSKLLDVWIRRRREKQSAGEQTVRAGTVGAA